MSRPWVLMLTRSSCLAWVVHPTRPVLFKQYATKTAEYGADQITVLEGLEAVRKRPGMYIGSTGVKGLHHLVFEILDNAIDEAMGGHATKVDVVLGDKKCTVSDDGRGIPCDLHPKTGRSALETVLCVLHAGGKFGGENSGYKVSGGLHGVGLSVVNALSKRMDVQVKRDKKVHSMSFAKGKPMGKMDVTAGDAKTGTTVTFEPDASIFKESTKFDADHLAARMDELAYLNAGVSLTLKDAKKERNFRHDGGITEYVDSLLGGKTPLHVALGPRTKGAKELNGGFSAKGEKDHVQVEAALRWSADQYSEATVSFANGIRTADGGTHLEGMRAALTKTVNNMAKKTGKLKADAPKIPGEFIREGLTAVLVINAPEVEFEGQTKSRLGSPGIRQIVDSVVTEQLVRLFEWQPKALAAIVDKAVAAQQAATAAKAARDLVRRKSLLATTVLPGKLADCSQRDASRTEIFIVEGDSAAGSAKQGRDRNTQAILPLRGKILNIEKCAPDKIYQNSELQALTAALGLGIRGEELKADALRYGRVIVMTDADVDGAHIRALILTFFYRYQRELVHRGHVFVACPPLYKLTSGKQEKYCWDDDDLKAMLETMPANTQVQRFKGLGEMMPAQLWDTTMDPKKRRLLRVDVEDAAAADQIITLLMGDDYTERKEYITQRALGLDEADLDI